MDQRIPITLRVDYTSGELNELDAANDPIEQFARWFAQAIEANVREANAMTLATAEPDGAPSARIVLLKDFDDRGFTFYTNFHSRKGRTLARNPRAALVFFWPALERQVRIEGMVQRLDRAEAQAYFDSRPLEARLGAWASDQSQVIASRRELVDRFEQCRRQFAENEIPLPEHWGGYVVVPESIEFWQGRTGRLHDRLRYHRHDGAWRLERLAP